MSYNKRDLSNKVRAKVWYNQISMKKNAALAKKIPQRLQSVLWSTDVNLLDTKRDKNYIIHQVLLYGTFKEIQWLMQEYTKREIIDVFIRHPSKIYPKNAFYFIKNFILQLKNKKLLEEKYVSTISGQIKLRAARSI